MSATWILLLAAAVAAAGWLLRRRSAERRAECRRRFAALLDERRPGLSVRAAEAGWTLRRQGEVLGIVDGRSLTRAAADEGRSERLFLAVADAADHGPRPLTGEFDLKRHGARSLPRLADQGLPLLALGAAAARYVAPASAGLATIYLVDGEPRPAYVTDDHLAGAGIDARGLHGVALAVLRQRFEESEVRAALTAGRVVEIAPPDGCGGSRLLLLPEALADDETLFACAPSPALLLIAAERAALDDELAGRPLPRQPLPPAVFRATAGGLRMES